MDIKMRLIAQPSHPHASASALISPCQKNIFHAVSIMLSWGFIQTKSPPNLITAHLGTFDPLVENFLVALVVSTLEHRNMMGSSVRTYGAGT